MAGPGGSERALLPHMISRPWRTITALNREGQPHASPAGLRSAASRTGRFHRFVKPLGHAHRFNVEVDVVDRVVAAPLGRREVAKRIRALVELELPADARVV